MSHVVPTDRQLDGNKYNDNGKYRFYSVDRNVGRDYKFGSLVIDDIIIF